MSRDEEARVRLDPKSLRGLAHPLRVRILGLLRRDGSATATTLADRLGQSTGATSYHLRQLAAYGFVVEDTERGVGRERWWRAAHHGTMLDHETALQAPVEAEAYLRSVAATYAAQMERWIIESQMQPPEWQAVGSINDWSFRLTPAEATRLREELSAIVERYRGHNAAEVPEGAETVALQWHLMPFTRTDEDGDAG
jgi:predicted ArsR family transcriptional regulator